MKFIASENRYKNIKFLTKYVFFLLQKFLIWVIICRALTGIWRNW